MRRIRRQGRVIELPDGLQPRSASEQHAAVQQHVHPAARADAPSAPQEPQASAASRYMGEDMVYDASTGEGPTQVVRTYQQDGRNVGAGYFSNPFEEAGRERIGLQWWEAPLGGHVRAGLEGQELFGHRITDGQARTAEQAAAGLLATGIGVPAFLAAVQGLSTPRDQGAIPM